MAIALLWAGPGVSQRKVEATVSRTSQSLLLAQDDGLIQAQFCLKDFHKVDRAYLTSSPASSETMHRGEWRIHFLERLEKLIWDLSFTLGCLFLSMCWIGEISVSYCMLLQIILRETLWHYRLNIKHH